MEAGNQRPQTQPASGKATAALFAGLVSLFGLPAALFAVGGGDDPASGVVAVVIAIGLALGIAAIAWGLAGRREVDRDPSLGGHGMATAGIVMGALGALFVAFLGIFVLSGGKLY